jgi:hypothetical protein
MEPRVSILYEGLPDGNAPEPTKITGLKLNSMNQNYSSRDITKKKPKVIRTITNVLTTLDAFLK